MADIRELFRVKQGEMSALLLGGRAVIDHPVEKGAATEENWRRLLRSYLPRRYMVASGMVVDVDGKSSDQIDALILDNQYTPVIFESGGVRVFPAEGVYAAFEVKQSINKREIEYAGRKIASLRNLRRTSAAIPHAGGSYQPIEPVRIIGGLLTTESDWTPPLGEHFEESLNALEPGSAIDIGCVIEGGAFAVDCDSERKVIKSTPDMSLVFLVLRLLDMLQALGTVAAIDYSEWLRYARQSWPPRRP